MRLVGTSLAAVLIAVLAAHAQPPAGPAPAVPGAPPGPPPAAPADPVLDRHLLGWQEVMGKMNNFRAEFELTRTEAVFKKKRVYTGSVLCMKPNFARLRLDNAADKADYEAYICNGKAVYEYNGLAKTITEFKLNPAAGADNLMLDFLGGMKAGDAKKRFQITQFNPAAEHYVYLDIKPVLPKDKQEFEHIRFALYGPNVPAPYIKYAPAEVYLLKPNGDTEQWKFSKPQMDVPGVDGKVFEYVKIDGWAFKQAPVGPPPGPMGPPVVPGGTGLPPGPSAVKPRP